MYSSQIKANKKWCKENREHSNYLKNKSACKSFIRNKATLEDLQDIKELINAKEKEFYGGKIK